MKKGNKKYLISLIIIVFVIIISIAVPLKNNKKETTPIQIAEENNGLPKLENFENLYNIVIKNKKEELKKTNSSESITDINNYKIEETKTPLKLTDMTYSKTNIQVEGVDEGDIAKTDGQYIYYITNQSVKIIGINEQMKIISNINYKEENFNPNELYFLENKLIVIGNTYKKNNEGYIMEDTIYPASDVKVYAKVYNLSTIEKPILEREVAIEGNYVSSRMIGENIYIISNKYIYTYLFKDNIEEMNENDYKPKYIDSKISESEQYIEYKDISYFPEDGDLSYLNIAGFNVNSDEAANIESFLAAGDNIYCSNDNLYVTKAKFEYKDQKLYGYYNNYDLNTYIYKFKLDNSKIEYLKIGSVSGNILNQFSMDEKDGYFRIVTTDNKSFTNETNVNNLYVLDENLQIVGKVENLAKGEKIYATRFMQDRLYLVTFVETDPLFVIDLSEPTNPIVLGELKIPGYSTYLHPYDETHLIGFGENTETEEDGRVVTNGMKIALFDVKNPSEPKELFSENIGEKGTSSEVLNNHKTLLISKEKDIIAFPIYISNLKFQGAIIYGLDLENGFTEKGKISHQEVEDEYFNYDIKKAVERIIFINDNIYTLSNSLIKETNIETMEEKQILELIEQN